MTKLAISPADSGTGTVTIKAPVTNTNREIVLPDGEGTVITNESDIEAQVKLATNASGDAPVYACRAWVNFNGTGTVAIRASGNVSSITDNGTGNYTINFTTAMPDANYSVAGTGGQFSVANQNRNVASSIYTTSSVRALVAQTDTGAYIDTDVVSVQIFR